MCPGRLWMLRTGKEVQKESKKMLDVYAKEFVAIGTHFMGKGKKKGDYIIVEKPDLEQLLDKNLYDTAKNKLKIWKSLHWIDADKDRRYTKRVYSSEKSGYVACVKMSVPMLELLSELTKKPQALS